MSQPNPATEPAADADLDSAAAVSGEDTAVEDPTADGTPDDALNKALLEAAQWKEVALRTAAELDNYRKRMAREMQDAARYGNAGLLESLLPILDNFEYGLNAAKAENEKSNLFIGLSMVARQLQDFLKDQGVEEVSIAGGFDPNLHEAMMQQPSAEVPEGSIISQSRKGYRLRDRLLRPASVVLSSGPAKSGG